MADKEVFVVGSHGLGVFIHCRRLPKPGESVAGWGFDPMTPDDGGKGANQAMCAARLGASTTLFCAIGAEDLGWQSLAPLGEAGVDLGPVLRIPGVRTGAGIVVIDAEGTSMIITDAGANARIEPAHVEALRGIMRQHRCLLTQFELEADIALMAARLAAREGARAFVTPGPVLPLQPGDLEGIDVIVPNETEAAALLGGADLGGDHAGAVAALRDRWGVRNVVLTRGGAGVTALWDGNIRTVPAFAVSARNTVGAGDGFTAALAAAIARDLPIEPALTFASAVAALSVTVDGGPWSSYPECTAVSAFMSERGFGDIFEAFVTRP